MLNTILTDTEIYFVFVSDERAMMSWYVCL